MQVFHSVRTRVAYGVTIAVTSRVLYVDPLGIKPSNVLRATSLKLCASFPNGKCVLKPVGCVSWSSPSDVALIVNHLYDSMIVA